MNKFKFNLLLSALTFGVCVSALHAGSETAAIGGLIPVELGALSISSGVGRQSEARRIQTDETGALKTTGADTEVIYSSVPLLAPSGIAGLYEAGNSTNTFTMTQASFNVISGGGCRNIGDNCNVVRFATQANKVYVKRVTVTNLDLTNRLSKVWMWDTRGSTPTSALFFQEFSTGGPSNPQTLQFPVEHYCSSGVTVRKDGNFELMLELGNQNR